MNCINLRSSPTSIIAIEKKTKQPQIISLYLVNDYIHAIPGFPISQRNKPNPKTINLKNEPTSLAKNMITYMQWKQILDR